MDYDIPDISFKVDESTKWAEEECLNIIDEYEADDPAYYKTLKSIIQSISITFFAKYDIQVKNNCYLILFVRTIAVDTSECHEYELINKSEILVSEEVIKSLTKPIFPANYHRGYMAALKEYGLGVVGTSTAKRVFEMLKNTKKFRGDISWYSALVIHGNDLSNMARLPDRVRQKMEFSDIGKVNENSFQILRGHEIPLC
jgi:hypothetical protein